MAPQIIAIIPARGGSKRIPHKNLLPLAGRPLVAHSILHAQNTTAISHVYVSTEDAEIAEVSRSYGALIAPRPLEIANDTATSESAVLNALDYHRSQGNAEPDLIVFLQPTSPVRRPDDIAKAIDKLLSSRADSLFSATDNNRLIWALKDGQPYSLNYDFLKRQREQDMTIQYRENGSLYVFKPEILRTHHNRLGGKIAVHEMDYWSSFQVDTPEHVELLRWVMQRPEFAPPIHFPEHIGLVVFDFDGVMTDNAVIVTETGEEAVVCNRADGWGIARLREAGVLMMVLSTERNPVVAARCAKLNLPCHQGVGDKGAYLAQYLQENGIAGADTVYIGNDVNDLDCLRLVGMPVAVADSHPEVLAAAQLILTQRGGHGAVREFCELVLRRLPQRVT